MQRRSPTDDRSGCDIFGIPLDVPAVGDDGFPDFLYRRLGEHVTVAETMQRYELHRALGGKAREAYGLEVERGIRWWEAS